MTIGHTREILTARGFQLKKHARNELCGPCPWCGGTDRFIYKIDQDRYWCRQCEKNGDAIQLLRDLDGLSFQEAKKALGDNGNSARPPQSRPQNRQRRTQEGQDPSLTSGVKSSMAATYDYTDPDGRLIYQVCRFEPGEEGRKKDFKQRRPGKKEDEWIWNLKNTELMLYRLPDITKSSWVFLLEGEKDVDLAHELKIKATTNSGGANKLKGQQNKHQVMDALKGKAVYIIPDNDESGFKHAEQAAELLHGIAREIRIVKIPDQKPKGDFTDYVNKIGRDHVREELQSITEDAPVWKPPKTPPTATEDTAVKKNFPLTDLGNAERFIRDHGQDASFCWPHNRWLVWDGRRFGQDNAGVVKRKAKVTIRNIMNEAAKERDDDGRRNCLNML